MCGPTISHLERIAQIGRAADVIDMTVREPDLLNRDIGLLDGSLDFRKIPTGIDHRSLLRGHVHKIRVQFCSKGVTGTINAPAFAWVSVLSSMGAPYCSGKPRQHRFVLTCDRRVIPMGS